MKAIITGGAGFIGSHLCEYLLKKNYDVTVIDNLFTGSLKNLDYIKNDIKIIKEDITHDLSYLYGTDVDRIYNLACPASPIHYQKNPVQTIEASTIGVPNVLKLAMRTGARVLQASTSEVYGDPEVFPQTEEYRGNVNTIGPRACYDEGKRVAESILMDYRRQYGVDSRIIRIFNTYGPRMNIEDGRVVPNFITQSLKNEPITIWGDGKQTRSFCYVDDLVEGMYRLMESDFIEPVNIGNPGERTMLELAQIVKDMTGSKSEFVYQPLPIDDPRRRCPDITRAKKVLGWEPKVSLEDGLKKTIDYFRNTLE